MYSNRLVRTDYTFVWYYFGDIVYRVGKLKFNGDACKRTM